MISLFDIIGHIGTIISVACLITAAAAFFYIPSPERHYIVVALLVAAASSQIYTEGYSRATANWQAKWEHREKEYDANIAAINTAHQKAIEAETERVRTQEQANMAALKDQLDQEVQARQIAEASERLLRTKIAQAPKEADQPAPGVILDAIHGVLQ